MKVVNKGPVQKQGIKKTTRPAATSGTSKTRRPAASPKVVTAALALGSKPATRPAKARRPAAEGVPGAKVSGAKAGAKAAKEARRAAGPAAQGASARARTKKSGDVEISRTLALSAIEAALDKKAILPVLIDVSHMGSYTDFIGILSGRSDRQVDAIAENVRELMKTRGRSLVGQEGLGSGRWTLLDFGDVVIHVFFHPVRQFYDLEGLWIDAPRVSMDLPPEAFPAEEDAGLSDPLYGIG